MIIAYDGSRFLGWQKTRTGPSIQEELEKALEPFSDVPIQPEAASRTDRGVHAKGQVVCFKAKKSLHPYQLQRALNSRLCQDIRVQSIEEVTSCFHPTLDALSKEYHYWICSGPVQMPMYRYYSWHVPYLLDLPAMRQAALHFYGTHDFSAFSHKQTEDANRTIEKLEIEIFEQTRLRIALRGDRFLYKMARSIVGTLVYVGRHKIAPDSIPLVLASRQRQVAAVTAPGHGLFLMEVFYQKDDEIATQKCGTSVTIRP
jgi:tRNA pseudouridine38-40 synthase